MTRGLMIAAPRSGSGKTTVTLGLLRAFKRRGVDVVGLKSGPDYIDPAFHAAASGREGVNLDSWAMPPELLAALAAQASADRGLVLCEASMGLFDGVPATSGRSGASADVAAALGAPVLMVIDVTGQAQSAAAVVKGCASYDGRLSVAGVVVNRVGSERHRRLVVDAIEAMGIPVVGALPRNDKVALPERHLGLVQAGETEALDARLETIADFVEAHVDCDRVLALAGELALASPARRAVALRPPGQRIALARDAAFRSSTPISCRAGGRRAPRSYLLAACRRAAAVRLRFLMAAGRLSRIARRPACGGGAVSRRPPPLRRDALRSRRMRGLYGARRKPRRRGGRRPRMAGLLGVQTSFEKRRMTLGYREARIASDCALGAEGEVLRGHEFHYATIVATGRDEPFAFVRDAYGAPAAPAGSRRGRVTGSFFHLIAEAECAPARRRC